MWLTPALSRALDACLSVYVQMVRMGRELKSFERPSQWLPVAQPFSQENQMLTPKMSLRRANVLAAYQDKVDALYAGKGNTVRNQQQQQS